MRWPKKKNDAVKVKYILVFEVMFCKVVIEHLMFENMIYNWKRKKSVSSEIGPDSIYMYYVFKAMDLPASVLGIIITFLPLAGRSAALSFSRVTPPDWSNL